jgi:hypothetical protein
VPLMLGTAAHVSEGGFNASLRKEGRQGGLVWRWKVSHRAEHIFAKALKRNSP